MVQDPSSVGAALRTISLRLRGTSTKELEEAGEDTTGVVESKSKLRTKIQGYTGVDILTDTGAYKSTYEILLEISKVWDNLTDSDRAGLLELIAGKTRSNTAAAILSNTEDLEEALLAAQKAEGSAVRENEKYLDSIQGKIDQFNNAIQAMWNNTLDSDVIKWIVNLGTQLIKLVDKIGLLRVAFVGLMTYIMHKNNISFMKMLFGPKDVNIALKGLDKIKNGLVELQKQIKEAKKQGPIITQEQATAEASETPPQPSGLKENRTDDIATVTQEGLGLVQSVYDKTVGAAKTALGKVGSFAKGVFDKATGAVVGFGQSVVKVATSVKDAFVDTGKSIAGVMSKMFGTIKDEIDKVSNTIKQTLVIPIKNAVSGAFKNVKTTLSQAFENAKGVATKFKDFIVELPGDIKFLFGLTGALTKMTFGEIAESAKEKFGQAKDFVKNKFIDPTTKGIAEKFGEAKDSVEEKFVGPVKQGVVGLFEKAKESVGGFVSDAKFLFGLAKVLTKMTFSEIAEGIADKFGQAKDFIKEKFIDPAVEGFTKFFNNVKEKADKAFSNIQEFIQGAFIGAVGFIEGAIGKIKSVFGKIQESATNAFNSAKEKVAEFITASQNLFKFFGQLGVIALGKIAEGVKEKFGEAKDFIKNKFIDPATAAFSKIKEVATNAFNSAKETVRGFVTTTQNLFKLFSELAKIALGQIAEGIKEKFGQAFSKIKEVVKTISDSVKEAMSGIIGAIKEAGSSIVGAIKENIIKPMKGAVENAFKNIKDAFKKIPTVVKNAFGKVGDFGKKAFAKIQEGATIVSNGIKKAFTAIKGPVSKIFQGISKTANNAFKKIKDGAAVAGKEFAKGLGYGDGQNQPTTPDNSWYNAKITEKTSINDLGGDALISSQIEAINKATAEGVPALNKYMTSTQGMSNAMKAYAASLNGGKGSLSGFVSFLKLQNAELDQVPPKTFMAKLGMLGLKAASMALNAAISMGLSFIIQFITEGLTKLIDLIKHAINPTVKWREELGELKSQISDVKSEIDSLNSELDTTQERIAELLAKDSLTFTEKEELDNLQKQNDELEREIYLLEQKEKRLQSQAQNTFDDVMKTSLANTKRDLDDDGEKDDVFDRSLERRMKQYKRRMDKRTEAQNELIQAEKELEEARASGDKAAIRKAEDKVTRKQNKLKRKEKSVSNKKSQIDEELAKYISDAEGIDYESADAQTREYLDYINNAVGKMSILEGDSQAKSMEIKRIFNKDSLSGVSDEIKKLVEELSKNPGDDTIIKQISEQCELAKNDLAAVGLSVKDATDYFTQLGTNESFNTIEGKINEINRAAANFEGLLRGNKFKVDGVDTGLVDLFDEEGKIIQTKLSQVFQGTSEQTRQDITKLLEGSYDQIKNRTVDTERLLEGFGLKATQQIIDIQNRILGEQNVEFFPNLKDEIDGIIDKFDEFSKAIGSVVSAMDTLQQARAEETYSGSVSIETLENLMQYTDDYAQLIEVDETGAIKLAANAEEILINQRIEKIKTDAAAAVQTAQANLAQAQYNEKAVNETGPVQSAMTAATDALAGAWAYLGSILGDVTSGNFSGIFDRAKTAYSNVTAGREEERAQVNISVEDAQKALENALDQQKIANALTSDNIKSKYDSNTASGGTSNEKDAEDKKVEEGWEALVSEYENKLALINNERSLIEAEIDKAEARGGKAATQYYQDLKDSSEEEKALLQEKYNALKAYLDYNENAIDPDTWTEYNNELNEIAVAIKECEINTIEWNEAIREIDLHYFEQTTEAISQLGEELDFVNSLLEDEEVADENGNWSSAALTRMGMYTQQMEKAATEAKLYQDEIDKLNTQYEKGELSEEQYQDRLAELVSSQRDAINSYEDAKDGIVELNEARIDAIKEGIEKEIEAYEDYINTVKDALSAGRD